MDPNPSPQPESNKILRITNKCLACGTEIGARLTKCDPCHHKAVCLKANKCDCLSTFADTPKVNTPFPTDTLKVENVPQTCYVCNLKTKLICGCGKCYLCDIKFGKHNKWSNKKLYGDPKSDEYP